MVYIVASPDFVIGVYSRYDLAERHARCMTGCKVVSAEIRHELPREIREDIAIEHEYDEDEDTPVIDMDDIKDSSE